MLLQFVLGRPDLFLELLAIMPAVICTDTVAQFPSQRCLSMTTCSQSQASAWD